MIPTVLRLILRWRGEKSLSFLFCLWKVEQLLICEDAKGIKYFGILERFSHSHKGNGRDVLAVLSKIQHPNFSATDRTTHLISYFLCSHLSLETHCPCGTKTAFQCLSALFCIQFYAYTTNLTRYAQGSRAIAEVHAHRLHS